MEIKLEDKTKNACCRTTSPWAIRGNKAYAAHVLLGHSRGASPRGLDAIAWASAGGGAAQILAVPPGGRRAPLRGAGSSPGRGVRPCRGGAARPWCPPVVAALVAEDPAPSLPVGDGWHLVIPRRIWRRLDQGPLPPTRRQEPARRREPRPVPTDLVGHGAEQQVAAEAPAAAAATEGCGEREGEVGRGGGSRGERESVVFFLFYSRKPWFERGA